jgi:hypothetical protein
VVPIEFSELIELMPYIVKWIPKDLGIPIDHSIDLYIENGRELVRPGREALPLITFHYQNLLFLN